jgi:hypothetical protein
MMRITEQHVPGVVAYKGACGGFLGYVVLLFFLKRHPAADLIEFAAKFK